MTTRRVIIDCNANSPLRVSAAGVDASGADVFTSLLFDANQAPIRIALNGWMRVPVIDSQANPIQTINHALGPSYPAVPPGTWPLFLVMWRQPNYSTGVAPQAGYSITTPTNSSSFATYGQGAGGSVEDGVFRGISFTKTIQLPSGQWTSFPDDNHIAYCIFRNFQ
jgi:hypothetical protein